MRKSKFADNQGKCCDSILRILEERQCARRSSLHFPEKENHLFPVELVCTIGATRYAFEHTRIEAYPGQIQDGTCFTNALDHLETSLSGALPTHACYMLIVPANSFQGVSSNKVAGVGKLIEEWVIRKAPSLIPSERQVETVTESIEGIPFQVSLQAIIGIPDLYGQLRIARYAPAELETLRFARIKQTLDNKLPKLQHWMNQNASGVLILESEDVALTNCQLVLEALKRNLIDPSSSPDYVFFIDTSNSLWRIHTLISDKKIQEQLSDWPCQEFEVARLVDVLSERAKA